MAKDKKKKDKGKKRNFKATGPLTPQMFTGLNEGRMASSGGKFADAVRFKQGDTVTVQFLTGIDGFVEIDQHQFRDGNKWNYIPCGGDGCPMCADDDEEVAKVHYRFFANVWDFKEKRVALLEGPKTLSRLLAERFKKNPKAFLSRTWDISKLATQPVSYDVDRGEKDPVSTKKLTPIDIEEHIVNQFRYHFGDDVSASVLDDTDEGADALDDEVYTKKSLKKMVEKGEEKELVRIAKALGVKGVKKMELDEIAKSILKAQG